MDEEENFLSFDTFFMYIKWLIVPEILEIIFIFCMQLSFALNLNLNI